MSNYLYCNPKASTKQLLDLMSKFGKATGDKVKIQKSIVFLQTRS